MYDGGAPRVAPDSWLLREAWLAPVLSVVIVRTVTRVLGSEIVDDWGDEGVDSTLDSNGSFSFMAKSCGDRSRISSSVRKVCQLRRRDDTIATSIGREAYEGGPLASTIRA